MTTTPPPAAKKRPLALTLVLVIILLSATINIIAGALSLYVSDSFRNGKLSIELYQDVQDLDGLSDETDLFLGGNWVLLVGIAELVISIGFARQRQWAWVAIMTWQALNLLIQVSSAVTGGGEVFSLIFSILLVLMLNQSAVRRAFGIVRQTNEPSVTTFNTFDVN